MHGTSRGWMAQKALAVAAVLRALLGVPDYERYLAHMRRIHPLETPLARTSFEQRQMIDRYSRPGSKCC